MTRPTTQHQHGIDALARQTLKTVLSRDDEPPAPAVQYVTVGRMKLVMRQWRVLTDLRQFRQLRFSQIHALRFHDVSRKPCDRAVHRLLELNLIEVVRDQSPGGEFGGSAEKTYQLATEGWKHFPGEKRRYNRTVSYHTLAVADVYIQALQASRDGWLQVIEYAVETDAWMNVAGADLRPDLYMKLEDKRGELQLWIEVDLGGERQKQIQEKLDVYKYAVDNAEAPQFETDVRGNVTVPQVLYLATDEERVGELRWIVKRTPGLPDGLVTVELIDRFPGYLR